MNLWTTLEKIKRCKKKSSEPTVRFMCDDKARTLFGVQYIQRLDGVSWQCTVGALCFTPFGRDWRPPPPKSASDLHDSWVIFLVKLVVMPVCVASSKMTRRRNGCLISISGAPMLPER